MVYAVSGSALARVERFDDGDYVVVQIATRRTQTEIGIWSFRRRELIRVVMSFVGPVIVDEQ